MYAIHNVKDQEVDEDLAANAEAADLEDADVDDADPMFEKDQKWDEFQTAMDEAEANAIEGFEDITHTGSYNYMYEHLDVQLPGKGGLTIREQFTHFWDILKEEGGLADTCYSKYVAYTPLRQTQK
jgi:hypothetical protein